MIARMILPGTSYRRAPAVLAILLLSCTKISPTPTVPSTSHSSDSAQTPAVAASGPSDPKSDIANSLQPGDEITADAHVRVTSLEERLLMAALVPGWPPPYAESAQTSDTGGQGSSAASSRGKIHVESVPHLPGVSASDPEDLTFVPDPKEVVMLDATHAVLITDATAGELPSGGSYVLVGTYFFNKDADAYWTLVNRIDVATWGLQNESWEVKTEKWPGHGVVLSLITEDGNQGSFTKEITMTLLTFGRADHMLHASLSQQDDGYGTELDSGEEVSCQELEMPGYKLPAGAKLKDVANCKAAEGAYRFDGDLIRFDYRMVSRTSDENGLRPLDISTAQAVYQFQAGTLKLIVGKDPELGY